MRKLSTGEILELSKRKGVKGIAAQKFLTGINGQHTKAQARANLFIDADLYQWNKETRKAIMAGIKLATKENERS